MYAIAATKSKRIRTLEAELERLQGRCAELEGREAAKKGEETAAVLKLVQHHQATVALRQKLEG